MLHPTILQLVDSYHKHKQDPERNIIHYNHIAALINHLACYTWQQEAAGRTRADIINELTEPRKIFAQSPFMKRTQTWPRGYQGDFETIEHLFWATNMAPQNSFAYFVEEYAMVSPTAQQHRNKVQHQARLILECILKFPGANILSIGCGGCLDIRTILSVIESYNFRMVLNDMDGEALQFSQQHLQPIREKCIYVNENIIRSSTVKQNRPYNLVISGGVFDYLKDKAIILLLKNFRENLMKPGAIFFFTNIKKGNPIRMQIEYFGDWILIERSEAEISDLCQQAGFAAAEIQIKEDTTGLAYLVTLTKTR